ncbi:MAG: hypothetical protein LN412_05685 [Candidatus Thermoplasmatota archaeon]|nr:hypothetical protein [Candidatus Thermoplasmatota archaeon]
MDHAPNSLAKPSFSYSKSTAITLAPARTAICNATRPTPPQPKTTTV